MDCICPDGYRYYYFEHLSLVGRIPDASPFESEVYQPGSGWIRDAKHEISDRIMGYEPDEEAGWKSGHSDIMADIRAISCEEAIQFIERNEIKIVCSFSDVSEHDMDMLILEEFACSDSFLTIFTETVGISNAKVMSVHSSKTDVLLGESDITIIIESNGERIGLLIEDKINAIAMPNQAERYSLRGQKGIAHGDYNRFFVFIIAPRNYLSLNAEAQKYPHKIEYERILSYFESINDSRSAFKVQQIRQAIEKQKKGYQAEKDPAVTDFWSKYSELQKAEYPEVDFIYNNEIKAANATWPRFRTAIDKLYMYHKTESGFVDLTFENCADRIIDVEQMLSDAIGDYAKEGYSIHKTNKSAAIRLTVPVLNLHQPFNEQKDKVEAGLSAVKKMSDLARTLNFKSLITLLGK